MIQKSQKDQNWVVSLLAAKKQEDIKAGFLKCYLEKGVKCQVMASRSSLHSIVWQPWVLGVEVQ